MTPIQYDRLYQKFLKNKELSETTKKQYEEVLINFTEAVNKDFTTYITEIKKQQYDRIENNKIIKYDPDFSQIAEDFDKFIKYLQDKGIANSSINLQIQKIKSILKFFNIQLPTTPTFETQKTKWYPLTKEDIKYCLDTSNMNNRALITFLTSTGMRRYDVTLLKVKDFIYATRDYHKCRNVEDFLENAPKDMIGFWSFEPHKTIRNHIKCKTCNTPEASNNILFMLRERQKLYSKKYPELKVEEDDPLFGSDRTHYKKPLRRESITDHFNYKNKKLQNERERVLNSKLASGGLAEYEYNRLMMEKPKFHPHALRKYFITTAAENIGNLRVCALMEGHTAPMGLDDNYVQISDDLIKEEYHKLIEDLSFENTEVNFITSKKRKELEQQIMELKEENKNIKENIDEEVVKAFMKTLEKYKKEIYSNIEGEVKSQKWD